MEPVKLPDRVAAQPQLEFIINREDEPSRSHYRRLLEKRAASLFGNQRIPDPMEFRDRSPVRSGGVVLDPGKVAAAPCKMASGRFLGVEKAKPFRLNPRAFIETARQQRPERAEPNASSFSNWIYSLYGHHGGSVEDLEAGIAAEALVAEAMPKAHRRIFDGPREIIVGCDPDFLSDMWPEWELVHLGLRTDDRDQEVPFFTVPELAVGGRQFGACPDIVYRNSETGEVLIVEVKLSRLPLPDNLWPNIWGQLWCYAQIPMVKRAERVTVVGEVWGQIRKYESRQRQPLCVGLRASVHRDARVASFDRFFRTLFEIYRGNDSGLLYPR